MIELFRSRLIAYRMPELIAAVFFLGTAFFVLLVTGIEYHLRMKR